MPEPTSIQQDKELVEKINRLVGMAVLKNDKNYAWDILKVIEARDKELERKARLDELQKFTHSENSVHLLAQAITYKPEGHDNACIWPILEAPNGVVVVIRDYVSDRVKELEELSS
ncbi:hypothetical protein ACFU44_13855 [Nocardia rhizosphaerihabitans]|uniref:hypothetical protein n=1 Tax=Nocardia rhizosphaerihabitans TaxID=1691570 RepID=UPI00366D18B4